MLNPEKQKEKEKSANAATTEFARSGADKERPRETGGPKGLEPTRYGDWEKAGRCIDF